MIDETRLWSVARSGSDIRATLSTILDPNSAEATGLEAYYTYSESGTDVLDSSGKGTSILPRDGQLRCVFAIPSCRIELFTDRAVCGDAKRGVDASGNLEECDDGNSDSGDGCSSTCTVETGWVCSPSVPGSSDICVRASRETLETFDALSLDTSWTLHQAANGAVTGPDSAARYAGVRGLLLRHQPMFNATENDFPKDNLHIWMRGDRGITTDSSDPKRVTSWMDSGPLGWEMAPPTDKQGPMYLDDAYNGHGGIRFDAEKDTALAFTDDACSVEMPYTIVAVFRYHRAPSGRLIVSRDGNNFVFGPYNGRAGWHMDSRRWIE